MDAPHSRPGAFASSRDNHADRRHGPLQQDGSEPNRSNDIMNEKPEYLSTIDLSALQRRRPFMIALHTGLVCICYAGASALGFALETWWMWLVAWYVQGLILVGVTGAIHECIHRLYAKGRNRNRVAGVLWSIVLFKNYTLHKCFHMEHHRHTTQAGDPEPHTVIAGLRDFFRYYIRSVALFNVIFAWRDTLLAWRGRFPAYVHTHAQIRAVQIDGIAQSAWLAVVVVATISWPRVVLFSYVIPVGFFTALRFFIMLPEHFATQRGSNPFENTRTVVSNFALRSIFWNNNYHAEHHAYPTVPFYHLPRLHARVVTKLRYLENSYLAFHSRLIWRLAACRPVSPPGKDRLTNREHL